MLEVVITKYRRGDRSMPEVLGRAEIVNDGGGSAEIGNYDIAIFGPGGKRPAIRGRIVKFPRLKRGVWHLLMRLLVSVYAEDTQALETAEAIP